MHHRQQESDALVCLPRAVAPELLPADHTTAWSGFWLRVQGSAANSPGSSSTSPHLIVPGFPQGKQQKAA